MWLHDLTDTDTYVGKNVIYTHNISSFISFAIKIYTKLSLSASYLPPDPDGLRIRLVIPDQDKKDETKEC